MCDKGFVWNPSNCECECDKSCDIGEYLDYENCKCRKKLIDTLVEECTENIGETEVIENENIHENKCSSCIAYIILFSLSFVISIGIGVHFIYSHWYLKKDKSHSMLNARAETTIY